MRTKRPLLLCCADPEVAASYAFILATRLREIRPVLTGLSDGVLTLAATEQAAAPVLLLIHTSSGDTELAALHRLAKHSPCPTLIVDTGTPRALVFRFIMSALERKRGPAASRRNAPPLKICLQCQLNNLHLMQQTTPHTPIAKEPNSWVPHASSF